MLINIGRVWDHAKSEHLKYVEDRISQYRQACIPSASAFIFDAFLNNYGHSLAIGSHVEQVKAIRYVKNLLRNKPKVIQEDFMVLSRHVFNYGNFSSYRKNKWGSYALCKKSTEMLCPYCQQSFCFTVDASTGKFRPQLDHFFKKSDYPYLAISLFNLIPCCGVCNSSLKGDEDFVSKKHLHPFFDTEEVAFLVDPGTLVQRWNSPDALLEIIVDESKLSKKGKNSVATFLLKERYRIHQAYLTEFVDDLTAWCDLSRIDEVNRRIFSGSSYMLTEKRAIGFDMNRYRQEFLGKIRLDLLLEFRKSLIGPKKP
ncbi:hypothetical protein [Cupriavidus oxalaticus]|uniref:HNH endonuclease n=1 Tax=Cupriavidus oxalaticus TaxID=96344 RepID=A0A4P7LVG6_9BURK|nr:hypothetical protein [Cupriavidus oxalaticus]QBY56471.1 hypothetical protein E0W60_36435 [Cupriavidus oxalaticus]